MSFLEQRESQINMSFLEQRESQFDTYRADPSAWMKQVETATMTHYFALYALAGQIHGIDFHAQEIDTNGRDPSAHELAVIRSAARLRNDEIATGFHSAGGVPIPHQGFAEPQWLAFYSLNRSKPLWQSPKLRTQGEG